MKNSAFSLDYETDLVVGTMNPGHLRRENRLTDGRTTPLTDPGETDPRIRGSTRRGQVTEKVVTWRSVAGGSNYEYEFDSWESTPKTDYTYSRSSSYLKQPTNDYYISPNMSRRSLRGRSSQLDEHSSKSSLINGEGGDFIGTSTSNRMTKDFTSAVAEEEEVRYMTLRSRTLMSKRPRSTGWQSNNTFEMLSMHGTDVEEEEVVVRESVANYSAVGNHRSHATNDESAVVRCNQTLYNRLSSFLLTVIQTCVTVITYLPKKASALRTSSAAGFLSALSSALGGNQSCHSTGRQRDTVATTTGASVAMTTGASGLRTSSATSSRWTKVQDALWTVSRFVFLTLPVGLVGWAAYAVVASSKACWQSANSVWGWFEKVLYSTVTKSSRAVDAVVLSRATSPRRHCGCCCLVVALSLLPLLVISLLYAASCHKEVAVIDAVKNQFSAYFESQKTAKMESSAKVYESSFGFVPKEDKPLESTEAGEGNLLAIAMLEERMRGFFLDFVADHKVAVHKDQEQALAAFRSQIDQMVKLLVQRELQVLRNQWTFQINSIKSTAHGDRVHVLGEQHKQLMAIEAMRTTLGDLAEKSTALSDDLILLRKSWKQHSEAKPQIPPVDDQRIVDLENHLKQLNQEFSILKTKHEVITAQVAEMSSDEQVALIVKTRIRESFAQIMTDFGSESSAGLHQGTDEAGLRSADGRLTFGEWLSQRFISQEALDGRLAALSAGITKEVNKIILASKDDPAKLAAAVAAIIAESRAETVEKEMTADSFIAGSSKDGALRFSAPCTVCGGILTEADVLRLIQAEIGIYDADKTGKVDYALESAGGSVISVRCSETYQLRTAQTSVFGIPLWYTYNSPRVVIQSGVQPGECWPFTGSKGYVVVQLSRKIFVTEVSIEHIPKSLAPNGMIDSAPKDCEIWGLENEMDSFGAFLGAFTYSSSGKPIQTFKAEHSTAASFRFIELKINSNHGNDHFTCLYRFRVHGHVDPTDQGSA